jgi:hypothetical protein
MKTCSEMRLENARALSKGSPAEFARLLEMTSQQANALIGPNPVRGIGHDKAREIEAAYGKPSGWLDHDHSTDSSEISNTGHNNALSDEARELILCVTRLDALGDLARKTFIWHTGLLQLSSAYAELQTLSARAQMLEETDRLMSARLEPGASHGKHKK